MTTISYGGGLEATSGCAPPDPRATPSEQLEFAPRGFFNIGRRNVGGRNRTRRPLHARQPAPAATSRRCQPGRHRLSVSPNTGSSARMRQPRAFWASDVVVTAAAEQGIRTSFNFARKGVNADMLRRLTRRSACRAATRSAPRAPSTSGSTRRTRRRSIGIFPQVRLSTLSGALSRDTRDNVLDPHRGGFLSGEGTPGVAVARRPGRLPEDLPAGILVPSAAGAAADRLRRRAARSAWRTAFRARRSRPTTTAIPIPGPARDRSRTCRRASASSPAATRRIRGFALDTVGAPNTISANGFPARRQRRGDHERRAAGAGLARVRRRRCSPTAATSSIASPTSISESCAARSVWACATSRRSDRSASTSASSSIAGSSAAVSSRARSGTSASGRRFSIHPRGVAPRTPRHADSRAASPARAPARAMEAAVLRARAVCN